MAKVISFKTMLYWEANLELKEANWHHLVEREKEHQEKEIEFFHLMD